MPRTPADFGGPLTESEYIKFLDGYGSIPDELGSMIYFDGYFYGRDQIGAFNLRNGGGSGSEFDVDVILTTVIGDVVVNRAGNVVRRR